MNTPHKRYSKLLYNGGECFVNRMGSLWTVDVFDFGSDASDDPVYHQAYGCEAEALADMDSWKAWEES